jgi:hypothetical protein
MSELDAALAVEPKQPVRTERNFALTKGIAGAVRCGTQARCPFRVKLRTLSTSRCLPLFPQEQTSIWHIGSASKLVRCSHAMEY